MNGVRDIRLLFTSPLLLTKSDFMRIMQRESKTKQNREKNKKKLIKQTRQKKCEKQKNKSKKKAAHAELDSTYT